MAFLSLKEGDGEVKKKKKDNGQIENSNITMNTYK